jgi:nucleotide-binding universal stress UspA family protein
MRILICTDGSPPAEQSASLVTRLNFPPETAFTVLGVSESDGDQVLLTASFERIEAVLGGARPGILRKMRYGHASDQILKEVGESRFDLVVLGARGHSRHLVPAKIGSTLARLIRAIAVPLLVARDVPEKINRALICTAAEAASLETVRNAGMLLAQTATEVSLLHVMSQVALRLDSLSDDLVDTAQSAMQRGTREGRHRRRHPPAAAVGCDRAHHPLDPPRPGGRRSV